MLARSRNTLYETLRDMYVAEEDVSISVEVLEYVYDCWMNWQKFAL